MGQPPYDPYGQQPYGQPAYDPYGQQAYGQPPQGYQPVADVYHYYPTPRTNGLAVTSMILGIVGFFTCGFGSILAIIFGHISQSQMKRTGENGSGMALAGVILGYLVTAAWIIYWVVIIALAVSSASPDTSGSV